MDPISSETEQAQMLLKRGLALELVRSMQIRNRHHLGPDKTVNLIALVAKSLSALERERPESAERALTELLAILVAEELGLSAALGFELMVRDESRKVLHMANRICRDEAELPAPDINPESSQQNFPKINENDEAEKEH